MPDVLLWQKIKEDGKNSSVRTISPPSFHYITQQFLLFFVEVIALLPHACFKIRQKDFKISKILLKGLYCLVVCEILFIFAEHNNKGY
jgi:hypothetical protein